MTGNVVITSKEDLKIPEGIIAQVVVTQDYLIWSFKTVEMAIEASKKFMEAGFEYVKREA